MQGFTEFLEEAKKVQGIKGTFSKLERFNGTLPVLITIDKDDKDTDELTNMAKITFSGSTWQLEPFEISDLYSQSKYKKVVKAAIEKMLAKDYDDFFREKREDEWEVEKYTDFIIEIPTSALK